jgi:uncharacterized membrane-anchored protein
MSLLPERTMQTMTYAKADADRSEALTKVPKVTLLFWIVNRASFKEH